MSETTTKEPYKDHQNRQSDAAGFGPPVLDEARYLPAMGSFDIDEEDQRELMRTLWSLLISAVDLNLGIDPIQILFAEKTGASTISSENMVQSDTRNNQQLFEIAAAPSDRDATEERS